MDATKIDEEGYDNSIIHSNSNGWIGNRKSIGRRKHSIESNQSGVFDCERNNKAQSKIERKKRERESERKEIGH